MTETVKLTSPIDGSIYVERPVATDQAINAAVERARTAQADWARLPVAERAKYMLKMLEALVGMADEIVPELAWQMGRPVRYGGEFGGVKERTQYMVEIAERALAPVPASNPKDGFRRYVKKDPLGVVMVIAPWNYPYLTSVNTIVPALIAGSTVILKHAAQTLLVGERFAKAFELPACRNMSSRTSCSTMRRRKNCWAPARSTMSTSPAPLPAGAPSRKRRRAPS